MANKCSLYKMLTLKYSNTKHCSTYKMLTKKNVLKKLDTKKFLILWVHSTLTDQNVNYTMLCYVNLNDCKRRWRRSNFLKGFPFDETLRNFFFNNGNLWLLDFCFWFWLFDFKILSFEINLCSRNKSFLFDWF